MDVYAKMKEMNIVLPKPPGKGGIYTPAMEFCQGLVYVSGCGPCVETPIAGKLGIDFTVEQGQEFARSCMLNVLSRLQEQIKDLNRVLRAVKILAFVNSADDFIQQPLVVNGGSQLLLDLYGEEAGMPARSAIGVNVLPRNIPVEIEVLFELKK